MKEGRPEFSKNILKSTTNNYGQFYQIFVCKPEFCSNQQAQSRPWMKLPSDYI